MFQISEVQESPAFSGRRSFVTLRERAEVDGFTYYNASLSAKGNQYPDSKSKFLKGTDSYMLLTLTKNPTKMVVEIKGLDGSVLDRKVFEG